MYYPTYYPAGYVNNINNINKIIISMYHNHKP